MPHYDYQCEHCGIIEIFHGIKEKPRKSCPQCGQEGLTRLISCGGAFIIGSKEMNQYNDCLKAKHWRDKNGNLHRVTAADGSSKSGTTTSRKYRSDDQVNAMKQQDKQRRANQRKQDSYRRFSNRVRKGR
jgi:putative FmdB family regulatory protein